MNDDNDAVQAIEVIDVQCGHPSCHRAGTYMVEGRCGNCDWDGFILITRGHEKPHRADRRKCPRCGCGGVVGGSYVPGSYAPAPEAP